MAGARAGAAAAPSASTVSLGSADADAGAHARSWTSSTNVVASSQRSSPLKPTTCVPAASQIGPVDMRTGLASSHRLSWEKRRTPSTVTSRKWSRWCEEDERLQVR